MTVGSRPVDGDIYTATVIAIYRRCGCSCCPTSALRLVAGSFVVTVVGFKFMLFFATLGWIGR